jgi:hypothetical protein
VLEFLSDQNFLSALAAMIGPMVFFAAPTEEIEQLLLHDESYEISSQDVVVETADIELGVAA